MKATLTKLAACAALAVVLTVGIAGSAKADDRHGEREWREHELRARHWHRLHPVVVTPDVYAPPLVVMPPPVYAPPVYAASAPVYAAPAAPSLNFIIPLHIH